MITFKILQLISNSIYSYDMNDISISKKTLVLFSNTVEGLLHAWWTTDPDLLGNQS